MYKIFFLLMLFLAACTRYEPESEYLASKSETNNVNGFKIYQQNCIACHGSDGTGAFASVPDLTRISGFRSKADSETTLFQHVEHIRKGIKTPGSAMAMPANGGNPDLTEQDIKEVLMYMHEEFTN